MANAQKIKEMMIDSMKAKNELAVNVYRGIMSSFTNELIAKGKKPTDELNEEDCLTVIGRLAKQRRDSIEQFRKGGREDLAVNEEAELKLIEALLPAQMSEEEIRPLVESKKAELGITDKSKIGVLLGALMKDLRGKADGAIVKKIVEESLSI